MVGGATVLANRLQEAYDISIYLPIGTMIDLCLDCVMEAFEHHDESGHNTSDVEAESIGINQDEPSQVEMEASAVGLDGGVRRPDMERPRKRDPSNRRDIQTSKSHPNDNIRHVNNRSPFQAL